MHELHERIAKDRKRVVREISSALLGPIVGKMPKSSVESLEKLSYLPHIQKHIVDILPITDSRVVKHDVHFGYPPFIRTEAVFGKRNLYVLKDAVVSPHSGMVWIGNRILEESVGSLRRIMDWGDVLHEPLLPVRELEMEEPIVACHSSTYYHWLLEVLPNVLTATSLFPQARILLPDNCPSYVTDGLATAIGPEVESRFITSISPVRVETLLMPQYNTQPEFTHPTVIESLRSQLKTKAAGEGTLPVAPVTGRRIYISRRRSRRRRLVGEELLEQKLRERGFAVLHCDELSFNEQIRIFHEAETVIAVHGAGLSNLLWAEAPCKVIEIFPKNYILDCFAWLSFSLGFDYRYVICSTGHMIDEHAMDAVLELL